ncbi:MAG: hypothetical protein GY809_07670 [Planctomycetes bacterium]|nr:hypothetical protein [Planctomycetota bacterium]
MRRPLIRQLSTKVPLSLLIAFILHLPIMAQTIPYPGALNNAAIVQSSIGNVDTEAMVIGNGDINALIYAKADQLVMHLAKNDVWDARLITEKDPPLLNVNVGAHTWSGGGRPASWNHPFPTQTPPAVIQIHATGDVTQARIDLRLGLASIRTRVGQVAVRALAQKNVYYIETDSPVSLAGFSQRFLPAAETKQTDGVTIVSQHLPGDPDYAGMDVYSVLESRGARHAVATVTTRESASALSDAIQLAKGVLDQASHKIVQDHEREWRTFWSQSGVTLDDTDLQNWWYRQLYYLRCLSRPGAYAIALQGGYNSKANWHGTWTMNYNAEQTFWSAFSSNHVALAEPFIDLVNAFHPRARWYAKTVFHCEGAASPHNLWPFEPDPAQCVSVNKRQLAYMPWSYGIGTAGHMAHNLWMHYVYSGDTLYLENKIYPIIKDYALFYGAFIETCKLDNGKVVFGPSVDPEHTPFGWDNSPYDIAWAQHTLKAAIQGAHILGVDSELVTRWSDCLGKLPYYPVSGDVIKVGDRDEGYNIITPIVPLFPAEQVSWFSPEKEKALFKRSIQWIDSRYNHNNSVVMLNVARARLSMTDEALHDTKTWFKGKEQPNGLFYWQAHGFYMSEQTAVCGLITEFVIQSVDNIIRIFPAWPRDKDAEFTDLRTRGGFLVSARQKNSIIKHFAVESTAGGELKLLSPWDSIEARDADGRVLSLVPDSRGIVRVSTKKGQKFDFVKKRIP